MSQEQIQVPKGWEKTTVGKEIELAYGKNLPKPERIEGDFPVYGSNGIVGSHNKFLIDFPSIVIGRKGTVGSIHKAKAKFWPTDVSFYVKINDVKKLQLNFVYYLLLYLNLPKYGQSGPKSGLNRNDVYKIEFILPPLPTQKKIVQKLDDILGQLGEKKKAVFSIIDQNKEKIDFFEKNWNSFIIDSELKKFPDSQKIILADCIMLRSGNLKQRRKLLKNGKYAVFGGNGIMGYSDEYLLEKQTIVIGRVGANCGAIHKTDSKCWVTDNALYCILKKEIDLDYLYYVLKNLKLNSLAKKNAQPVINQTQILSKQIPLPPIPTQKQIVQNIKDAEEKFKSQKTQFENIKENYENSIIYVNHIQSLILNTAFSGKLVK